MSFATGAIVGWPFALALSLPFVFEELFVLSGDKVDPASHLNWMFARWRRLILASLVSALIFVSSPVYTRELLSMFCFTSGPRGLYR